MALLRPFAVALILVGQIALLPFAVVMLLVGLLLALAGACIEICKRACLECIGLIERISEGLVELHGYVSRS